MRHLGSLKTLASHGKSGYDGRTFNLPTLSRPRMRCWSWGICRALPIKNTTRPPNGLSIPRSERKCLSRACVWSGFEVWSRNKGCNNKWEYYVCLITCTHIYFGSRKLFILINKQKITTTHYAAGLRIGSSAHRTICITAAAVKHAQVEDASHGLPAGCELGYNAPQCDLQDLAVPQGMGKPHTDGGNDPGLPLAGETFDEECVVWSRIKGAGNSHWVNQIVYEFVLGQREGGSCIDVDGGARAAAGKARGGCSTCIRGNTPG